MSSQLSASTVTTRRKYRNLIKTWYATLCCHEVQVAVNKPSRLQVLPAALFFERTVLTLLQQHYAGFRMSPAPVHRLGRGTSGVSITPLSVHASMAHVGAPLFANPKCQL